MIAMARGGSGLLRGTRTDDDPPRAPQLIVADEPTTALDTSVQAQILLLFDRLRRDHGTAILFVTHDLAVAGSIADRIVVMYAGRLCEVGVAPEVLAQPTHPYTAALLAANRELRGDGRGSVVSDQVLDPINLPPGCAFAPRCPRKTAECDDEPPDLIAIGERREVACLHPLTADQQAAAVQPVRRSPVAAKADAEAALSLSNVSKAFASGGQQVRAVRDVTLTIKRGACVGLVGESGSGKTTVLRLAAGLTKPDAGSVEWTGRRPQLVYQDATASLTPWMTIGDQIAERLALRGVPRAQRAAQTAEYLDRVQLDRKVARALPRALSGGQRQRAAIARALSSDPQVLLCDEPVSALDATLTVRILRLLDDLRTSLGVGLLVVTHDLDAARAIAQEIFVMYHGRVVERAPTARVFDDPRHPYSKGLLAASPGAADGHLAPTLEGEPPDPFAEIAGCAFVERCPIAVDRCRVERPPLRVLDDGSEVACHLA
jgi:peptide/nickel transport system ATP-binding protein